MVSLRLGTRGSPLALAQARLAADALRAAHGHALQVEIVPIRTTGDRVQDRPLHEIGGKALWTKELDRALLAGETDLSVHSMKDVETFRPDALHVAALLPRADVRDRLVGAASIAALAEGARFGTSSPRRAAQLLHRRPDLTIVPLRGNVATRLAKLAAGEVDATLLAAAGLLRLGLDEGAAVAIDELLPAPSQGAVGLEVRSEDVATRGLVEAATDETTAACVRAERALLAALKGDCRSPVAALATREDGAVRLRAELLTEDGRDRVADEARLEPSAETEGAAALAAALLDRAPPRLAALFAG
ncbi:MAG: Porphobilinogen deaminase [uncultured Sphingomonadaceae bacterium]|uniref:Porphobilinogen deaminase n=1 Tax=uncultured Sphingomonadaceae bacterium TaxID=169976 RepID=A0A6J4SZK8_9SPHN|nr:MAG: Porphobilinogen deaminase [uncultured Sphingomonadaceae bacterium]